MKFACEQDKLSDHFIYFNDDFFILNALEKVTNYHRGLLDDHPYIDRSRSNHKRGARSARRFLKRKGVKHPLSYELHTPMVVNKRNFLRAIQLSDNYDVTPSFIRTIYGNWFDVDAEQIHDVKVFKSWEKSEDKNPDGDLISTSPKSWSGGKIQKEIKKKFSKPSKYEKE